MIIIKNTFYYKSSLCKITRINKCCTEITCTDNNHIMSTVNTKNFSYLIIKILYIISVSLLAKPSKIVQILSYLRCGNLHPCTEFF